MTAAEVRARLADAAILLDFDGSLAPIVERPEAARPLREAPDVLRGLRPRVRRLAIVTGRPAAFVEALLPGIEVVGLYGTEGAPDVDQAVREEVAGLAGGEPGATLEDKGTAVAVHVRGAADPEAAAAGLRGPLARIAAAAGLRLLEGKRVLELAAPGSDKGVVVRRLAEGAEAVAFAGDDLADLAAFDELGRQAGSGLAVCRIAVGGPETPEEVLVAADLVVDGPEGLLDLLASW